MFKGNGFVVMELKDNQCKIIFFCNHSEKKPCVYFKGAAYYCRYHGENYECFSSIANVNRMTIEIKKQTGE